MKKRNALEARLAAAEEIVSVLDEHCATLLAYFCYRHYDCGQGSLGFNELFRELKSLKGIVRKGFSRRTLARHLRHLVEEKQILEVREAQSNLKIKPRIYELSPYFLELTKDLFATKVLYPVQVQEEFKRLEIEPLTIVLLDILVGNCVEMMKRSIEYPEVLAAYFRENVYLHFGNLMQAFRTRVLEANEKDKAIEAVDEFDEFWKQNRNKKWANVRRELKRLET
jgi:DNA-binding HxlR family transcriptional regulator